jgi:hypothetical protein
MWIRPSPSLPSFRAAGGVRKVPCSPRTRHTRRWAGPHRPEGGARPCRARQPAAASPEGPGPRDRPAVPDALVVELLARGPSAACPRRDACWSTACASSPSVSISSSGPYPCLPSQASLASAIATTSRSTSAVGGVTCRKEIRPSAPRV